MSNFSHLFPITVVFGAIVVVSVVMYMYLDSSRLFKTATRPKSLHASLKMMLELEKIYKLF